MPKRQSGNKKGKQSNFAKLSIFQPNKYKFKKTCPLSVKGAPKVDYKNIKCLKVFQIKTTNNIYQTQQIIKTTSIANATLVVATQRLERSRSQLVS